jgi:hypothetical protein
MRIEHEYQFENKYFFVSFNKTKTNTILVEKEEMES